MLILRRRARLATESAKRRVRNLADESRATNGVSTMTSRQSQIAPI
jgi:hypothetical protein